MTYKSTDLLAFISFSNTTNIYEYFCMEKHSWILTNVISYFYDWINNDFDIRTRYITELI